MNNLCKLSLTALSALLISACQSTSTPKAIGEHMQGYLTPSATGWQFESCNESKTRAAQLNAPWNEQAQALVDDGNSKVFVDWQASLVNQAVSPTTVYRLQGEGFGCDDPDFKRLALRATGNTWSASISKQGMLLTRVDTPPLAVPYVEEALPNAHRSYTSQANGKTIELWISPGQCVDAASGMRTTFTAQLLIDQEKVGEAGCAYPGGAEDHLQ